jgi:hypothetical protein
VPILWIFNTIIFHMLFLLSKNSLYKWISACPFVQNDVFLKIPYNFVDMYLTHLGTSIWSPPIHIYPKNWLFWPSKLCCIPCAQAKKLYYPPSNLTILQTIRNKCVRFGGHVDIQVSYKILRLEVPKKPQFCTIRLAFKKNCFEATLDSMRPWVFRS